MAIIIIINVAAVNHRLSQSHPVHFLWYKKKQEFFASKWTLQNNDINPEHYDRISISEANYHIIWYLLTSFDHIQYFELACKT